MNRDASIEQQERQQKTADADDQAGLHHLSALHQTAGVCDRIGRCADGQGHGQGAGEGHGNDYDTTAADRLQGAHVGPQGRHDRQEKVGRRRVRYEAGHEDGDQTVLPSIVVNCLPFSLTKTTTPA